MKKFYFFILLVSFLFNIANGQELKRIGILGIATAPVNDSILSSLGVEKTNGVIVTAVRPNTTASEIKILENDVITKIINSDVKTYKNITDVFLMLREGDKISFTVIRNKETISLTGKVIPKPKETYENSEVIYDKVKFQNGYLRTIITKPKTGEKHPAIFFIPGYTCYSLDNLGSHPYGQLFKSLVDKGYVLMRVEKPGMGDCEGTPDCFEIDLNTEVEAFEKGYEKMLEYDFVDKDNIIVFGHSLGGIEGPMVAEKFNPRGIVVYGTGVNTWYEYLLEMFRFQNPLMGISYLENEKHIQSMIPLLYDYLIQKKTPAELSANSDYKKLMESDMEYDGKTHLWSRDYKYWQQIQDLNLTEYWAKIKSNVLVIWGECDFEAFSRFDHESIIEIVNQNNPGKGTFYVLPNTDHAFAKVESVKKDAELMKSGTYSKYMRENFNTNLTDKIDEWINSILK